jgi:hypothetical protein
LKFPVVKDNNAIDDSLISELINRKHQCDAITNSMVAVEEEHEAKIAALIAENTELKTQLQAQIDAFARHMQYDYDRWLRAEEEYAKLGKLVASDVNLTTEGQERIDITEQVMSADGFTVVSALGGSLVVEVVNHYYSNGIVYIKSIGDEARMQKWSSAGLYTSDVTMTHTEEVSAQDTVYCEGITKAYFTPYRTIV